MAITGRDLAILSARVGVERVGASRVGFCPEDVEGPLNDEPGEYIWKEDKPDETTWTLETPCVTCPDICVASFTSDVAGGVAPLTVVFTDTSSGDVTFWYWVFGDGDTSNDQNPTHVFATAGTYNVELWISGPGGSDGPATGTITVLNTGTISGTVYAADGITPMPAETVNLTGAATDNTTTSLSGTYSFPGLTPGDYTVECQSATNSGTLTSGATLTLDIVLNPI